jgi:hypothetical protein
MVVNGFTLPVAFVQLCEAIQRGEAPMEWELKEDVDAYGHPLPVPYLQIICDPERMQERTEWIIEGYLHENRFQDTDLLDDFTGVENFVLFADAREDMFYCFDFGADPKEPSVVYCWDGSWDRAAPNFEAFMALFVPWGEGPDRRQENGPPQPGDPRWEAAKPTPRGILAAWTFRYVVLSPEDRPFFEDMASQYAACSPEERREVEAKVREELEREGMTDDQRQTLDELWARLRATEPA